MRRIAVLLASVALAGCADDPASPVILPEAAFAMGAEAGVVVMTRNLYLGADLDPVIGATTPDQIPLLAAHAWATVQANDFPRRARALAAEIAHAQPHLVGLQEVTTFRVQSPGDLIIGGATPATDVAFDYLALLLEALAQLGMEYDVVAHVQGMDIEVPVYTGIGPLPFDDVRYMDADVILARRGVATSNPQGAPYAARLNAAIGGPGGPPISLRRVWTSIDAVVNDQAIRFFNTHLEVQSFAPIQLLQAEELLQIIAASPLPVVLVGDLNSAADGSQTATYARIVGAGFRDLWDPRAADGHTCCHAKDLSNPRPTLDQRLDLVMVRGFDEIVPRVTASMHITGSDPGDRARNGTWPSDHAGVVANLRIPPAASRSKR